MPRVWGVFLVLIFFATACAAIETPTPNVTATPAFVSLPTTTPTSAPTFAPAPALTKTQIITLTVWTTEELSPIAARGGRAFKNQVDAFTRAQPNLRVEFVLKKASGKGGMLDFLVNTHAVAPQLLPDLIVLDSRELDAAAQTGLLQPLDDDFPAGVYADLFPPAQKIARVEGAWLALPIFLEAEHLVYNMARVKKPPLTWNDVISNSATFLFPTDGEDGFLAQYLALGGALQDVNANPTLNADATIQVLTFYRRARDANAIPDSALAIKTVDEAWSLFAAGQGAMAQVSASQFLAERDKVPNANFAPLPTRDGQVTTLAYAWTYAMVTTDPARQRATVEFLQWLTASPRLAEWANAARKIPARRTAFASALDAGDYADFLRTLFEHANVQPTASQLARVSPAFRTAVLSVLRGQGTPIEAANRAVNSIK